MALASLTVDLTLALAKFEGDSGKAAQIVVRDQEKMSRAALSFQRALERQAEAAGKTPGELAKIRAAELGLSDSTLRLIDQINGMGASFTQAGVQGSAAMSGIAKAADGASVQATGRFDALIAKIREVNAQATALKAQAVSQNSSGTLTDDGLKTRLAAITAARDSTISQYKQIAAAEVAAQRVADETAAAQARLAEVESAAVAKRVAAFERLRAIVAQSNYKQGVSDQQQQAAATKAVADAEVLATERRVAAFEKLRATVAQANYRQSAASAAEQAAAAKAVADAEEASANRRIASFEKLRATVAQLNYQGQQKAAAEAASKAAAVVASNDAFIASLERQVTVIGKTRAEILALDAAQRGLSDRAAPLISRLRDLDEKTGQFGKSAFASRNQLLTLQYTISDVIASAGSGISPLTILLQQGGQVFDAFGGAAAQGKGGFFRNFIGTLAQVITPARLAIGGVASAVGVLGYAMYEGAKQSKEYADAIVLSGNFAGLTEGKFNALAKGIAASGQVNITAAREFTQALVATGQVGPQVLEQAAEAAARFGAATGKSAKEVAAEFATLNGDVTAGAKKLNESLNFLTLAQLNQIRTLQEQGRAADAQGVVYEALNARLKSLEPNLGTLDRALRLVGNTWRNFWDAAFDVGRTETIEDKIDRARARLADAQRAALDKPTIGVYGGPRPAGADNVEARAEDLRLLNRAKAAQETAAANVAAQAEINKKGAAAEEFVSGYLKRAKSVESLNKELAKANQSFADRAAAGSPVDAKQQAEILKKIREDFTDKGGASRAASEANQVQKAQLAQALKALEDELQREQAAYSFHERYLHGVFTAGGISFRDYYEDRRKTQAEALANEIDTLDKSIAAQRAFIAASKDPSDKVAGQTKVNEFLEKQAVLRLAGARAAVLSNQEEAASYKALNDRVDEYRAQLLQLVGDEAGAARLRAQTAIQNAKLFARQAGGLISAEDLALQARALEVANALAEAQRRVGFATADASRAEDAYSIVAGRVGASLYERDTAVYAIRVKLVEQLKDAADKTRALAEAERAAADVAGRVADPRILGAAADAAVQYAKALDTIDPALNRLRDSAKSTADGIADNIGNAINEFKGFPDLFNNISKTIQQAGTKFFVTDPLKVGLENLFKQATEGDNPIGNFLKSAAGVKGGGPGDAQTAAVKASTSALVDLQLAASNAAAALGANGGTSYGSIPALFAREGRGPGASAGVSEVGGLDAKFLGGFFEPAKAEAAAGAKEFGSSVDGLVGATLKATSSMGGLPGVIGQLASSLYTLLFSTKASSSGSGGGFGDFFSSLFGGSSGSSAGSTFATDEALALFFHSGGVVGAGGARGRVPASVFTGAQVLHGGGLAGLKSDEVPSILRRREEVLRRDDPRHRDNGGLRASRELAVTFNNSFAERTTRETINQMNAKQQVQLDRSKRMR